MSDELWAEMDRVAAELVAAFELVCTEDLPAVIGVSISNAFATFCNGATLDEIRGLADSEAHVRVDFDRLAFLLGALAAPRSPVPRDGAP